MHGEKDNLKYWPKFPVEKGLEVPDKLYSSGKTEIRKSPIHGMGVFAKEDIEKGSLIEQYYVVSRVQTMQRQDIEQSVVCGNFWYLNGWHKDKIEKTNVHGVFHKGSTVMSLYAHKDIKADNGEVILPDSTISSTTTPLVVLQSSSRITASCATSTSLLVK